MNASPPPSRFHSPRRLLLLVGVAGVLSVATYEIVRSRQSTLPNNRIEKNPIEANLRQQMRRYRRRPMRAAKTMADALRSDDHKTVSAATAQLVWQIHLDHASRDRQAARYWKYLADYLLAKQATPPMPAPTTSAREAAVAMLSATATRADLNPTGHAEESVEIESCLALLTRLEKNRTGDKAVPAPRGRPTGLARTFDRASRHGRDGAASDPTGASIADQFQFSGGGLPTH